MDTNASQALRMAAGVLIAVMLISVLVYSLRKLTPFQQNMDDIKTAEQLDEFNKSMLVYNKPLMYGVDVISAINKAAGINQYYFDTYGTANSIKNNFAVDINLKLKSETTESLQIYKFVITYKPGGEIQELKEDILLTFPNAYKNTIRNLFKSKYASKIPTTFNADFNNLWANKTIEKIPSGEYTLIDTAGTIEGAKYCSTVMANIIVDSMNLKKIVENPEKDQSKPEGNAWSRAIIETATYDLKTKKFKCTGVEYSDQTGRVKKMKFEEF